jgi:hypothetical protein
MAIIKTPIRCASLSVTGLPARCRKTDTKHIEVGDFPENMTNNEILEKCETKLNEVRSTWKRVDRCRAFISPGTIEKYDDMDGNMRCIMLFDPKEIRVELSV